MRGSARSGLVLPRERIRLDRALGRCLLSAGLLEEAIEALRQAVQVAPGNTQTYDELGIAYVRAGLLREAWELYRRVQDCGIGTG